MRYELYYWASIQGRGEFVRLALEEAGAPYVDVARTDGGEERMLALLGDAALACPPFAPPFLKAGKRLIAQTANILLFLGDRPAWRRRAKRESFGRISYSSPSLTWLSRYMTRITRSRGACITRISAPKRGGARLTSSRTGCRNTSATSSGCWRANPSGSATFSVSGYLR